MKKKEKIQSTQWLFSFQQMQREAGYLVGRICPTHGPSLDDNFSAFKKTLEGLAHVSLPDEFTAFEEALEKLPRISEGMKALAKSNVILEPVKGVTKSDVRIVRATQKYEVKALNAFIEACKLGINWVLARQILALLNSGETDYEVIASKLGCSREWSEKLARDWKQGSGNSRNVHHPLETAMFFRFTQAHKWWELSDKGHTILSDPHWRS